MKWERLRRRRKRLSRGVRRSAGEALEKRDHHRRRTLALSVATRAALAAPPEYNRGYNDCLAGRYDEGEGAVQPLLQVGMPRRARGTGGRRAAASMALRGWNSQRQRNGSRRAWALWRLVDTGTSAPRSAGRSHRRNLLRSANAPMCPAHQCERPGRRRARHRDRSALPVILLHRETDMALLASQQAVFVRMVLIGFALLTWTTRLQTS